MKVSVIGTGRVGSTTAFLLTQKFMVQELVLLDMRKDYLKGQMYDLRHSLMPENPTEINAGEYSDIHGSDVVIISAGVPRKPEADRLELLKTNANVIKDIAANIKPFIPENAVLITVTNPVDIMNCLLYKVTGLPRSRVIGMGSSLDSGRFRSVIASQLNIPPSSVESWVIGEHGASKVPVFSRVRVKGRRIDFSRKEKKDIIEEMESQNVAILEKKGATEYGPASHIVRMVECIASNKNEVIPCSVVLKGEYGFSGVSIGVPAVLGRNGAEKVLGWELEENERSAFSKAAEKLAKLQQIF
jgi:malate dehydrogenase